MTELYVIEKRDPIRGTIEYLQKPKGSSSVYYWVSDLQEATTYLRKINAQKQADLENRIKSDERIIFCAKKVKLVIAE